MVKILRITLIGAAAVNIALEEMNIESKIKWPNDIVIREKKIAGILTEMSPNQEGNIHVIMGIGVNTNFSLEDIPVEHFS